MSVPGIGPIISSAMAAAIGTGDAFTKGRDFAAWLGLVPKQISSGDRTIRGKISKRAIAALTSSRNFFFIDWSFMIWLWISTSLSPIRQGTKPHAGANPPFFFTSPTAWEDFSLRAHPLLIVAAKHRASPNLLCDW